MARDTEARKVRRYDNGFKLKAVKLGQLPGVHDKDVATSLDTHPVHAVGLAQTSPGRRIDCRR